METKFYAVVIERPNGDKRLFAWIKRNAKGEVFVFYAGDTAANNPARELDIHTSVHKNGRSHITIKGMGQSKRKIRPKHCGVKLEQPPTTAFSGNGGIFATNGDRALSPTLPRLKGRFNDIFEVPIDLLDATKRQSFGFQLVAANASPAAIGHANEKVVVEKSFNDDVPWIVVRLVQPSR